MREGRPLRGCGVDVNVHLCGATYSVGPAATRPG